MSLQGHFDPATNISWQCHHGKQNHLVVVLSLSVPLPTGTLFLLKSDLHLNFLSLKLNLKLFFSSGMSKLCFPVSIVSALSMPYRCGVLRVIRVRISSSSIIVPTIAKVVVE